MQYSRLCFIGLILMWLSGCGGSDSSSGGGGAGVQSDPSMATKLVAFGDSIGSGSPNWPTLVGQRSGVAMINFSQISVQTSHFVSSTTSILKAHRPTHLLVLLGTNDARGGLVSSAISNLQSIVNDAVALGVIPIVGTIPPNLDSATNNQWAAEISSGIKKLKGAKVAQVRKALGSGIGLFPDGIHPNAAGSNIIANAFSSQL